MTIGFAVKDDVFARDIFSVAQLNQAVGQLLEREIPPIWVRGEVSNFTQAASGHWYFTLKDARAGVRTVMFRSRAAAVGFVPRAGDEVEVRARVSLYEPRGDFQLQADAMRRAGVGNLYEAFLRLKDKLAAEGLFDPQRKRSPLRLPRAIGVVTSLHAAALRDVLSALARRAPQVGVIVYPAPVQGADAAARLTSQVRAASARREVDTLLLVRGGGSIEDLWSFNDEDLARAVAECAIPVITGVGHETDFTIADFVADVRAPTPTAAAELACVPRADLLAALGHVTTRLARAQQRRLDQAGQRLDRLSAQLISPAQRVANQRERLNTLRHRLASAAKRPLSLSDARLSILTQRLARRAPQMARSLDRVQGLTQRLARGQQALLAERRARLLALAAQLRALDPENTLARGYAIVRDAQGQVISQAGALAVGAAVSIDLAHGRVGADITSIESSR
ncbi:exodeoxyribonuclease VII large subunit [Bordetella holmesii]|uniref:Exodeoxyribonuclease 7 large subunit n=2 Tax=Bordetella holmesii TaxID=35814 RepID=A0A158M4F2_9BORD|nr:exodeoxyribonuclease VII large subunit [Bordetella holmesii]AHV94011.1 exodeoxyribonuclease VII, large subunit [Bordetella holmesii ATCC 51541]AIT27356.1 exodeoxyribonuclease VII, large subunit [Bordetella holmesii 44057]EWM43185.1 exodeoxyribonuclease VII, large subunit [Bordetella holmesii 41130]EWM47944.1 exodeoxyribonuclease VII, large subunit [Bordetella holmesii 35009]AMD46198.1 exodeoxyribonuclease VII large subunit [Bordetella holmesii H558]